MMATYKSSPSFIMDEKDFRSYREQVMLSIKAERMALMSNGKILLWIDEELAKFKQPTKAKGKSLNKS